MATPTSPKKYAEGTVVPVSKSREEIERLLKRYSASGFLYGTQETTGGEVAAVAFEMAGRRYRIELRYPSLEQFRSPQRFGQKTLEEAREREIKRLWRALALVIKAKLEAVKSGIRTVEQEFLADTVMANDQTVGAWVEPQLKEMYQSGTMPQFLPGIAGPREQQQLGSPTDYLEGEVQE